MFRVSRYILTLCLAVALGSQAPVAAGELGDGTLLSTYDRDLIRKPVRGRLKDAPRVPRAAAADPKDVLGTTLEAYRPGAQTIFPNSPHATAARNAARRHGIPVDLFMALVKQESNWNPNAVSHKGAIGLAQLMPGTAKILGVDPRDPQQNLEGGARYLAQQYAKFRSWRLALAAYNAGPGAVERYNGVPPYRETQNYVTRIMSKQAR